MGVWGFSLVCVCVCLHLSTHLQVLWLPRSDRTYRWSEISSLSLLKFANYNNAALAACFVGFHSNISPQCPDHFIWELWVVLLSGQWGNTEARESYVEFSYCSTDWSLCTWWPFPFMRTCALPMTVCMMWRREWTASEWMLHWVLHSSDVCVCANLVLCRCWCNEEDSPCKSHLQLCCRQCRWTLSTTRTGLSLCVCACLLVVVVVVLCACFWVLLWLCECCLSCVHLSAKHVCHSSPGVCESVCLSACLWSCVSIGLLNWLSISPSHMQVFHTCMGLLVLP